MALLIDATILLLLAGTLGYAFLVDRRVRALMAALRALEPVVGAFSEAVERSESSVRSLRAAAPRVQDPPLRRPAPAAPAGEQAAPAGERAAPPASGVAFRSTRAAGPAQLPPGVARVTGKADLVRGFFDTIRSREA